MPILQEAEWAPGPVWTGEEILAPPSTGIRSPNRPARGVVAIPTELSRPLKILKGFVIFMNYRFPPDCMQLIIR